MAEQHRRRPFCVGLYQADDLKIEPNTEVSYIYFSTVYTFSLYSSQTGQTVS